MASSRGRATSTPSPRPSESLTASRRAGKGENEQYLVRNAFLNWDKDASGKLDYGEFRACDSVLCPSDRIDASFSQATPCGN